MQSGPLVLSAGPELLLHRALRIADEQFIEATARGRAHVDQWELSMRLEHAVMKQLFGAHWVDVLANSGTWEWKCKFDGNDDDQVDLQEVGLGVVEVVAEVETMFCPLLRVQLLASLIPPRPTSFPAGRQGCSDARWVEGRGLRTLERGEALHGRRELPQPAAALHDALHRFLLRAKDGQSTFSVPDNEEPEPKRNTERDSPGESAKGRRRTLEGLLQEITGARKERSESLPCRMPDAVHPQRTGPATARLQKEGMTPVHQLSYRECKMGKHSMNGHSEVQNEILGRLEKHLDIMTAKKVEETRWVEAITAQYKK